MVGYGVHPTQSSGTDVLQLGEEGEKVPVEGVYLPLHGAGNSMDG